MFKSRTFARRFDDGVTVPDSYRSSLRCLERLSTSAATASRLEARFSELAQSAEPDSPQAAFSAAVLDRVAHLRSVAQQLSEDVDTYAPVRFAPGQLLDELNLLIAEKERQLLASRSARMNRSNVSLCPLFLRGTCTRGVACASSHTQEALAAWLREWVSGQMFTSAPSAGGGGGGASLGSSSAGLGSSHSGTSATAAAVAAAAGAGSGDGVPGGSVSATASSAPVVALTVAEKFGADAWAALVAIIATEPLGSLVLRHATPSAMRVLVGALHSDALASVRHLDLSKNGLCDAYPRGVLKLARALARSRSLASLQLAHNALGAAGACAIAQAFRPGRCDTLVVLDLQCNGIAAADSAFPAFCHAIGACHTVQKLSLARNALGAEGVRQVVEALEESTSLVCLDLFETGCGDGGAARVASFLRTPGGQRLRLLNLGWNGIGTDGAAALSSALESHTSLETLLLNFNTGIGRKGALALAEALKAPGCPLVTLDLRWASLGDDGIATIAEAVVAGRAIRDVLLGGNDAEPRAEAVIAERLRRRVLPPALLALRTEDMHTYA